MGTENLIIQHSLIIYKRPIRANIVVSTYKVEPLMAELNPLKIEPIEFLGPISPPIIHGPRSEPIRHLRRRQIPTALRPMQQISKLQRQPPRNRSMIDD